MNHTILESLARRSLGQPETWSAFRWESLRAGNEAIGWKLRGAVAPPRLRGIAKGRPNWKRRDKSTECEIIISVAQYNAFETEWVKQTGRCPDCAGKATAFVGWSRDEGVKTRPCPECQGTGKVASVVTPTPQGANP